MATNNVQSKSSHAGGSGEFLVQIGGDQSRCCEFRSHDSLCSFLGISEPYNTCQAYAPYARNAPHCARAINRNKRVIVLDLLEILCCTTVPSQTAATLLRKLSPHVVCGQTALHQYQAPLVFEKWCTRLWDDYLRANGIDPQLWSDLPPATFSTSAWEDALDRARQKQRPNVCDVDDSSSVSSSNDGHDPDSSNGGTPDTTTSGPIITASTLLSNEKATNNASDMLIPATQNVPVIFGHGPTCTPSPFDQSPTRTARPQAEPPQEQQRQIPQPQRQIQQTQRAFVVYRDPEPADSVPTAVVPTSSHATAGNQQQVLRSLDRNQALPSARSQAQLTRSEGSESTSTASSLSLITRHPTDFCQVDALVATHSPLSARQPPATDVQLSVAPSVVAPLNSALSAVASLDASPNVTRSDAAALDLTLSSTALSDVALLVMIPSARAPSVAASLDAPPSDSPPVDVASSNVASSNAASLNVTLSVLTPSAAPPVDVASSVVTPSVAAPKRLPTLEEDGNDCGGPENHGENERDERSEQDVDQTGRNSEVLTQAANSHPSDLPAAKQLGEAEQRASAEEEEKEDGEGREETNGNGEGDREETNDSRKGNGEETNDDSMSEHSNDAVANGAACDITGAASVAVVVSVDDLATPPSLPAASVAVVLSADSLVTPPRPPLVAAASSSPPLSPVPPGPRHPRLFCPYSQPMGPLVQLKMLLRKMVEPVCHEHRHRGFIYGFVRPSLPGFIKIGHVRDTTTTLAPTNRNRRRPHQHSSAGVCASAVDRRLARWEADCQQPVVKVFQVEITCPAVERIERLVHLTLQDCRRVQTPPCEPCRRRSKHGRGGNHREWFEIGLDAAQNVVDVWAQIANQPLYDGLGRLVHFWWTQIDRDQLGTDAHGSVMGWLATVPDLVVEYRRQLMANLPGPDVVVE